ncbi:DUF7509 family protein [Halosimplex marinum]|uniref:DUF7509 family protein n=1 Tax=Halosimplex marinum TaxID=3396620 RepID=UPI003F56B213
MGTLDAYRGEPIRDRIHESLPYGDPSDPLVFLMGPYRLLDPDYLYDEGDYSLPPDPLAPESAGVEPDRIEATLRTVAERISGETDTTAFIASDVDIPTRTEVQRDDLSEPGLSVIDQSVAFAKASAGNAFVFTKAGLTTGVGAETGAIPEYFRLRDEAAQRRDPRTFKILSEAEPSDDDRRTYEPKFSSASINEMDDAYDIRFGYFTSRDHLVENLVAFVESYVEPLAD